VPLGDAAARRIEHRVAGADASPHLALAAVLAALLHGVTNRLESSAPIDGRSIHGSDTEFPGDLIVALDRLEASRELAKYIPARYLKVYSQVKRGEYSELLDIVFNREYDFYA
jgi:glutamine synthetase